MCVFPFAAAMRMERRSLRMAIRWMGIRLVVVVVVVAADALGPF